MTTTKRVASGLSQMKELRNRTLVEAGAEIRAGDDDGGRRFVGHAAVFNSRTAIGNPLRYGFYEEIDTAAFDKTLTEADVRFLVDHDSGKLVARTSAGDLDVVTDDIGLAVDAGLDEELSYVKDLVRNLDKKRITGMSFGFYVVRDEWFTETVELSDGNSAEVEIRRILEVRLLEVSAVTFPAYEETDAGIRSTVRDIRAQRFQLLSDDAQRDPAPADEATRGNHDSAPADEATRTSGDEHRLQMRERELQVLYPTT